MENILPKRKAIRLKNFDYSSVRAYFLTICVKDRRQLLSKITGNDSEAANQTVDICAVGEGLDPPENGEHDVRRIGETGAASYSPTSFHRFIRSGAYPEMYLTPIGEIALEQLFLLEKRFLNVEIREYAIMPDHIHAIICFQKTTDEITAPSLFDVMRVYKSMTSRICSQKFGVEKLFQRSYIEHVIRDSDDYDVKRKYIYNNPIRWYYNHLEREK